MILPLLGAGAVISSFYVASERATTEQQTLATARDVAAAVERQLDGALAALRTLSLSHSMSERDFRAFHAQATGMVAIFPRGVVALRTADGQQLVNTALVFGAPLPKTKDSVLLDADAKALKTGQPVVSDLFTGMSTDRLFVAIVLPVTIGGQSHLQCARPGRAIRYARQHGWDRNRLVISYG